MGVGPEEGAWKPSVVRSLSFHSTYRCQNTGVCCSSGWDIAVETEVEARLIQLLTAHPETLPNGTDGFRPMADPPFGCRSALRIVESTQACWFRDEPRRACAIHRAHGEDVLPSACRQFPRVCVLEPDGVSISLSHYCPTAASLLFGGPASFSLVTSPPAFPRDWPFEGLDAREAYPPFLRPGVLLGFDGLRIFEERAIAILSQFPLWTALATIESAVARARSWTVGAGPLPELLAASFDSSEGGGPGTGDPRRILRASLTEGTRPKVGLREFRAGAPTVPAFADVALRKYLASRLIAAWITFQGDGLQSVTRYLRLCLDTVFLFESARGAEPEAARWQEAIREADLWLLHYCDPDLLARNLR